MKKKLLTLLLALVAIATTARAQENTIEGHEYVDLCLPSGTLWATCNVGATKPEEYGDKFAWGETKPKEEYSWSTYELYNGSEWCNGYFLEDFTELPLEYDAAYANWGGEWRMPTENQLTTELFYNCNYELKEINGVKGVEFTSKINKNKIFLPLGSYWSQTPKTYPPTEVWGLYVKEKEGESPVAWSYGFSCYDHFIRPVVNNSLSWSVIFNAENFPDENFRRHLGGTKEMKPWDYGDELGICEGDGISASFLANFHELQLMWRSRPISDLKGIEYFTGLERLDCSEYNQLTTLDVSKNTALRDLECGNNLLTSFDVSGCTALYNLKCENNQLSSIDVSKNTALRNLNCGKNFLTALDVSKNSALTDLDCRDNQLTSLDVSKNTALTWLNCHGNQLTSLDMSKNTVLRWLYCHGNQIKGEAMDALVASLPTVNRGSFWVINTKDENEANVCTKAQVAEAKRKGWTVYDYNGGGTWDPEEWNYVYPEYEGSDDPTGVDASLNDNGKMTNDNYYSIDGVKLSGEPRKKGLYIHKGKKVVK